MKRWLVSVVLLLIVSLVSASTIDKSIDITLDSYVSLHEEEKIFMFSLLPSTFSWPADENNLCAVWTVAPTQSAQSTKVCHGSKDCCSFLNLEQTSSSWSDEFVLHKGKYGAQNSNTIFAQIVYANYSLSVNNPYIEVFDSKVASAPAEFSPSTSNILSSSREVQISLIHKQGNLSVAQVAPTNGSFIDESSKIYMNFSVTRNGSVDCNISINNSIFATLQGSTANESIISLNEIKQGLNSVQATCADSNNQTAQSQEQWIIADYTAPSIATTPASSTTINGGQAVLNFTATDALSSTLNCSVFIDNEETAIVDVQSGQKQSVTKNYVSEGSHSWYVTCKDHAKNTHTTSTSTFSIDLELDAQLSVNKEKINIGDSSVITITAPDGADATIVLSKPKSITETITRSSADFPLIETLNISEHPGTAQISVSLIKDGLVKTLTQDVTINNSLVARIEVENKTVEVDESVSFTGIAHGSEGSYTYKWTFEDSDDEEETSSDQSPSRTYSETGTYDVEFSVTDKFGNVETDDIAIKVEKRHEVKVVVLDENDSPLSGATVYLDDDEETTDSKGEVNLEVREGSVDILIIKSGYSAIRDTIDITGDQTLTYRMGDGAEEDLAAAAATQSVQSNQAKTAELNEQNSAEVEERIDSVNVRIDSITSEVTKALQGVSESQEDLQETVQDMLLKENLREVQKELWKLKKDLSNLKFAQTNINKADRITTIEKQMKAIQESTIGTIEIRNSEEYVVEENERDRTIDNYFELAKITSTEQKTINELSEKLRKVEIKRVVRQLTLNYLSGRQEKVTLVKLVVDHEEKDTFTLLESIPKTVIDHTDNMEFISAQSILDPDPFISFNIPVHQDIVYYFKKEVSADETKSISTVLVTNKKKKEVGGAESVTGFAILGNDGITKNIVPILLILLILIAAIIYAMYDPDLRKEILRNLLVLSVLALIFKEMKPIVDRLKKGKTEIEARDFTEAQKTYDDINTIYPKVSAKPRFLSSYAIMGFYHRIVITKIVHYTKKIEELNDRNEQGEAKKMYERVQHLYTQLPKESKKIVSEYCLHAFKALTAA